VIRLAINANPEYFETEEKEDFEHELVAIRYVGPNRRYSNSSTVTQGRYPTNQDFVRDSWYVAFVPEATPEADPGEGLAWFERSSAFEVSYEPATIARILVEKYEGEIEAGGPFPGNDFGGFRPRVYDALGLKSEAEAGATIAEQLAELAGTDVEAEVEDVDPVDLFVEEYDRGELKDLVKETREGTDEFALTGKNMRDMAEFLVEKEVEP